MHNQSWHVVPYGGHAVNRTSTDVTPDTQLTDAWMVIFRMDFEPAGSPGPEIVVYTYAEYDDPNGQRKDGTWPDIVTCAQVAYEIHEEVTWKDDSVTRSYREVTEADHEYRQGDVVYPTAEEADTAARTEAYRYVANGDLGWDWNGESAMHRQGGPVTREKKVTE